MINKKIINQCGECGFKEEELFGAYKIFFGTLVSESRLRIINLLKNGRMNVSEIAQVLGINQASVSHDLARLKKCGFVLVETEKKFRYYALNEKTIIPLMRLIEDHMSQYCIHILRDQNGENG